MTVDRDTPLLLPPSLHDWVPEDHLVHFVIEAAEQLDLRTSRVHQRSSGSEQYPPATMLALLVYSYATGTFASRRIEQSTFDNVAVRYLCADTHPDHDTLCAFRRENRVLLADAFAQVLELAARSEQLQVGNITVAIGGTKILDYASRPSAVSYERSGKQLRQVELEIEQLRTKAADSTPLQAGLTINDELAHRTATESVRTHYKQRQQTVEPVFGTIKAAFGFQRFLMPAWEMCRRNGREAAAPTTSNASITSKPYSNPPNRPSGRCRLTAGSPT